MCYFLQLLTKDDQKLWKNLIINFQANAISQNPIFEINIKWRLTQNLKNTFFTLFNVIH